MEKLLEEPCQSPDLNRDVLDLFKDTQKESKLNDKVEAVLLETMFPNNEWV